MNDFIKGLLQPKVLLGVATLTLSVVNALMQQEFITGQINKVVEEAVKNIQ